MRWQWQRELGVDNAEALETVAIRKIKYIVHGITSRQKKLVYTTTADSPDFGRKSVLDILDGVIAIKTTGITAWNSQKVKLKRRNVISR
jgi:hypothetical protein